MKFKFHIAVILFMLVAAGRPLPAFAQAATSPVVPPSVTTPVTTPAPIGATTEEIAEKVRDPKTEAIRLLGRKQFASACLLLKKSFPEDTTDVSVLFLSARCRMGMKDYERALEYYERVVELQPDSDRAKTELAAAQKLYQKTHRIWYARLETGVTYDSNINAGPQTDQILVGGIPINLGQQPINAAGYLTSGSAGYIYALDRTSSLSARISASNTSYFHGNDNNVDNFSFSLGPTWNWGKTQLSISPGYSWQGFGGSAYNSSLDISGRLSHRLDNKVVAAVNYAVNKNNYRTVESKNGYAVSISPNLSIPLPLNMTGMMSLIMRFENDEVSYYSNDTFGFRFNLTKPFKKGLESNFSYQLVNRDYEAADGFLSTVPRADEQQILTAGLTYDISDFTAKNTDLNFRYQMIKTNSNIPIYDLDRHVFILSVSKMW